MLLLKMLQHIVFPPIDHTTAWSWTGEHFRASMSFEMTFQVDLEVEGARASGVIAFICAFVLAPNVIAVGGEWLGR